MWTVWWEWRWEGADSDVEAVEGVGPVLAHAPVGVDLEPVRPGGEDVVLEGRALGHGHVPVAAASVCGETVGC